MKTPWHLWVVGVASLVWNAGGAFDYVGVQYAIESYMANFDAAAMAFFEDLPVWYVAAWATGVWFSVLGSVLLLLRSRFALPVFVISLAGLLLASFYTFVVLDSSPMRDAGTGALLFTLAIYVVLVALILYSRAMAKRGVLR